MVEPVTLEAAFASYSLKKGLDSFIEYASKTVLDRKKLRFESNPTESILSGFSSVSQEVMTWSHHMEYSHTGENIELSRFYVDLNLYLEPVESFGLGKAKKVRTKTMLRNLMEHLVLLGRPGMGKTTALKAISYDLIRGKKHWNNYFPIPIVLRLRELDNTASLLDHVLNRLNISVINKNDQIVKLPRLDYQIKLELVCSFLNENRLLLLIDGFDEIVPSETKFNGKRVQCKEMFVEEFKTLCLRVVESTIILTSRTADFPYLVTGAVKYELAQLSAAQVKRFIGKYFRDKTERERAIDAVLNRKLLGTEFVPLTLTYLCIIYKKYGRLFNSRRETYNRVLDLLLDDWNLNRQIERRSKFEEFDTYDKKQFLRHFAYELTYRYGGPYFPYDRVRKTYSEIAEDYDGLTPRDFISVMRELETHTGLFVRAGSGFVFSHKTMQEYLFALYLYEFPEIPNDEKLLIRIPNELALAVSFNENPSLYFSYLVLNRFTDAFYGREFLYPFIDRLILEGTNFKVHEYLALSYMLIYSKIRTGTAWNTDLSSRQEELNYFYRFLNADSRIETSMKKLAGSFEIVKEIPEQNLVKVRRIRKIHSTLGYNEPNKLHLGYEFHDVFSNSDEV